MLYIKEITEFTEFLKIKDKWDKLLTESGINNPYLTHDWFRIAFEYFEKKDELFILLVKDEDEVITIAPFLISYEKYLGIPVKKIRFLENVHTPFQDIIIAQKRQESLETIVVYLLKNFQMWDILQLMEIRNNSENIKILEDLCNKKNIFHYQFFISRSWFVQTNMDSEQGVAKIKPKVRRELRRKIRRIERLGKLSFQVITELKDIEKHFDIFFNFHEQTWKGKEKNAEFYYKIARKFSQGEEIILYCLCLNECPIAYTFVLKSRNTLFCIKTTYDPSYYAFSPGTIMFHKILENSFRDKVIEKFDIGRGDEYYKQELTSYPINQINFFGGHKRTFASYLYHVRFKLVLYIKKKKLSMALLTFFKEFSLLIKKMPERIKETKKIFRKKGQVIVYHKKLSLVKTAENNNGWFCRKAELDDMEHLAVAMKVKKFSDLKTRLANENCFLIMKDENIHNYFWFSPDNVECGVPDTKNNQIVLSEFDPLIFEMDNNYLLRMFNMISNELVQQDYKHLFAFSKSIDSQRTELFESLGFQRVRGRD
ncbi:MAG: GNAT family N-acetyltransferase [Candidatus Hodarchaeota archaeon]